MASKEFTLDPNILGPGSAAKVDVSLTTDADVLQAIVDDKPFPTRTNGKIELGSIMLEAQGGNQVKFDAGQGTVGFDFSASFKTGAGVFDQPADAIGSLQLNAPPKLDLVIPGDPASRYLLMLLGYKASGSFSASHPLGVLGTLTFGAQASGDAVYAVLHRFPGITGAGTALGDTISSWRLPRQVTKPDDLKPGTWLVAEADGSLAIQVAAALGYDLNFVRKLNLLNLTRQLSAKIDLAAKATFGFSVSGRYLVVVGREDASTNVRLRLFKQAQNGITFGLNVAAGVTVDPGLPKNLDDFTKAVFGLHGLQILNDLSEWTDPNADLGQTAARLIKSEASKLLTSATGIDADQELALAHATLMNAIGTWHSLPDHASAALWTILGSLNKKGAQDLKTFQTFLGALADTDPNKRAQEIAKALQNATFGDTLQGQFLEGIAEQGVLALTDQLDSVQKAASTALSILNGGVIGKLQNFIDQELNLQNVLDATDPSKLNDWIAKRLGDFLDKALDLPALKEIQTAIHAVLDNAQSLYAKALQAITNRYSLELAATYERTVTGEALIDAVFDLKQPAAARLFSDVVDKSNLNELFTTAADGVSINQASMSHGIRRDATVQVHLPYLDSKTEHINESIASVSIEHDSGRVLVYQVQSTDKVIKNRYLSQMQIMGRIVNGAVTADSTVAYQMLQVKKDMTRAELEFRTRPFIDQSLSGLFGGGASSIDSFYAGLDRTVEDVLHNGSNEFGDVLLNLQTVLAATVLAAWIKSLRPEEIKSASMSMSRALQVKLRQLIPLYFFQNLDNLQANAPAAALLTWAALPISTSIDYDFQTKQIQRFNTDKDVFWNWPDQDFRKEMAMLKLTQVGLVPLLVAAQERLVQAGLDRADDFDPQGAANFQSMAIVDETSTNFSRLSSLLSTESALVRGAAKALDDIQQAVAAAGGDPSKMDPAEAIVALANAGAALTNTFNAGVSSIYGGDSLRALSSTFLVEATNVLAAGATETPKAMLNLIVLRESTTFNMSDFLTGSLPPTTEIALSQSLVSV